MSGVGRVDRTDVCWVLRSHSAAALRGVKQKNDVTGGGILLTDKLQTWNTARIGPNSVTEVQGAANNWRRTQKMYMLTFTVWFIGIHVWDLSSNLTW